MGKDKNRKRDKIYLGVYVSESTHAALKQIAAENESTVSSIVRQLIRDYIGKESA